jgi:VCBS repeat-containing protein
MRVSLPVPIAVDDIAAETLAIGGITSINGVVTSNDSGAAPLEVNGYRAGLETETGSFTGIPIGPGPHPAQIYEIVGLFGTLSIATGNGAWHYTLNAHDPQTRAIPLGEVAAEIFTYRLHDGNDSTDLGQLTINILGVDSAPVITSDGGGATATIAVNEGGRGVTTVTASDADGTALVYSIAGGADASRFKINAATGKLTFKSAPDYDHPTDKGHDNTYKVVVAVSDGAAFDTQAITVVVEDVSARIVGAAWSDIVTSGPLGRAGNGDDWLRGRGGNDWLSAGAGADTIDGGSGRDVLVGGTGRDDLTGGTGRDFFVFCDAPSTRNADHITDFRHDNDVIVLQRSDFRGLSWGTLRESAFYTADAARKAHDASDRIVYDSASGKLYYDADGKGGHVAVHFATLDGAPSLDASDFFIV